MEAESGTERGEGRSPGETAWTKAPGCGRRGAGGGQAELQRRLSPPPGPQPRGTCSPGKRPGRALSGGGLPAAAGEAGGSVKARGESACRWGRPRAGEAILRSAELGRVLGLRAKSSWPPTGCETSPRLGMAGSVQNGLGVPVCGGDVARRHREKPRVRSCLLPGSTRPAPLQSSCRWPRWETPA